jgi:hypothetical protein
VALSVVALLLVMIVPAGAAPPPASSFFVAECDGFPVAPPERMWMTGQDGIHLRGASNQYQEWILEDGAWRLIGTNTTHANGNASLPDFEGPFWGTFAFRDDGTIGDIDGSWVWANTPTGRAIGKTTDGAPVKITLGLDPAGFPAPPGDGCLLTEFVVIGADK